VLPGGVFIPETERTPQLASAKPLIAVSTPVTQLPGGAPGPVRAVAPQTVPGTGVFVRPSTSGSGGVKPTGDGDITFNFVNADVRDVLRELLGDQLHLQYMVDTKVQATVTAQTSGPIARTAVLPTLENILRASGVALVQAGGVYRVVPLEDANRASAATVAQPTTTQPGYGVRVLPLKFVKAAELKPLLDPFVPTGGVLETDNARNLLIVSGPSGDLDGFAALVNQFDVDWLAGKSFAIYPLHAGKAKEVTTELQAVLEQGSDGSGPLAGLVRVVPVERLNAILVITSRPSYLSQMKAWVDRLDYGDANATPRFFEYQVQKTRAVDLARVLRQLFPSSDVRIVRPEKSPRPSFTRLGTPVAVPSANGTVSSGLSGTAAAAAVPAAAPAQQQTTDEDRDQPGGGAPAGGPAGAGELALPPVRIVADEKNNTLVIFARPGDYRMIEKMLQKLDIAPQQVLIEATIAELTLNDDLQYGVQYFLKSGNKQFELSSAKTGSLVAADLAGVFPGFNYVVANASQHAIINLLKSVTRVTVLSSPQLLVRNHQTAGLQVGAQVPIVTQSAQSVITANAPVINSIEYRNTGVILEVTPRINPDGMISLEVDQEVSDVAPTTSSTIDSPTINDRHLVSSIMVQDGETIALGGLIREDTNDSKNGIPVLSDIPVVGPLFRTTDRSRGRTELLVLLSPKILKDTNDARTMTEDLRNRIRGLRPLDVPLK
jgi:general secretion pathway protein D